MAHEADWQAQLRQLAEATGARLMAQGAALPSPPSEGVAGPAWPSGPVARWWFALVPEEGFLAAAYAVVLGRAVDASGQAVYGPWCGTWLGRVAVLAALADSDEGRRKGASVQGVARWGRLWQVLERARLQGVTRWVSARLWRRDALRALWWQAQAQMRATDRLQAQQQAWAQWAEAVLAEVQALRTVLGRQEEVVAAVRALAAHAAAKVSEGRTAAEEGAAAMRASDGEAVGDSAPVAEGDGLLARFYRDLEAAFRTEDEMAERVRVYLPWIAPYLGEVVVDLGCGRGDWLAVAMGHGHRVLGVEPNAVLAQEAVARGVPVVVEEGLVWLRAQPAGSVAVLSALHVVEHLPFAALLAWLVEAARVVRPGGLLFLETPNPENGYVATHHFYNDPTHVRPLTPELLAFALSWAGFAQVEVVRLHPLPGRIEASDPASERLNGWLHGAQDFCVRGVRR